MLVQNASFSVRIHNAATNETSPVALFTAYQAPLAAGAIPPDDIDLTQVTIKTSPQDMGTSAWPATTKITSLGINANGSHGWQVAPQKTAAIGGW